MPFQVCRIEHVADGKSEGTEEIVIEETGESSSSKAETSKKVPVPICLKMNDKKTMNMEGVARLFLVKLYGEMPFLEFLEKQKSNQGTYVVKREKVPTAITGKKRLHGEASDTHHGHGKGKKSSRPPSKKRSGSPTKGH
uniref:Uncharacterized protein n=1 Tax=Meloidogyne incognita TaxID=6306 RepID=A0A914NQV4_MELIC